MASVASLGSIASAETTQTTQPTISASLGFGGVFKPDTWVPVYVKIADPSPREATIEIRTARGRLGHDLVTRVNTTALPTTYTLYAPVGGLDRVLLQLRDAKGRRVRDLDLTDAAAASPAALGGPAFGVASPSIGVAQRVATGLVRASEEYIAAGVVPTNLLPERPLGYGCLDVLVLPELDTDTLDDGVERAILNWTRAGGIVVTWPGAMQATMDSPLRAAVPATPGRRAIGLGQIVRTEADPTSLPADARLAAWRELTSNQVSLTANDRREGVFDPLVPQAVAEQSIDVNSPSHTVQNWLLIAALLGFVAGPMEILLLLSAGRHPRTWYTLGGLVVCVGASIGFVTMRTSSADARIECAIEADDGAIETTSLGHAPASDATVSWLTGDRADARTQPAGLLKLGQRRDGFEPMHLAALAELSPRVRSVSPGTGETTVRYTAGQGVTNSGKTRWTSVALVTADAVRVAANPVEPNQSVAFESATPIAADLPDTRRVETGIERLATQPGWQGVLLDRTLAERLVRLQESERATIVVARIDEGATRRFVLHVSR